MKESLILEEPLPELFQLSCDGMMLIDQQRRILAMNPAMERLTGYSAQDAVGKTQCGLLLRCEGADGCPLWLEPGGCPGLKSMNEFRPIQTAEYKFRRRDGIDILVSTSYTPVQRHGGPVQALVIMRNVTEQKLREHQLLLQSRTDPLTNLPNRTALSDVCSRELERARRYRRPMAVAMADLDGFKSYNDTYGHPAGDELLTALAMLLKTASRAADFIARYGGDEFALVLPESETAVAVSSLQRLRRIIARFPFFKGRPAATADRPHIPVRISFGVAIFPQDGATMKALFDRADYRLLQAKSRGGNRVVGPDEHENSQGGGV